MTTSSVYGFKIRSYFNTHKLHTLTEMQGFHEYIDSVVRNIRKQVELIKELHPTCDKQRGVWT